MTHGKKRVACRRPHPVLTALLAAVVLLNTGGYAVAESDIIRQYRQARQLETEGRCAEAIFAYQDVLRQNRYYIEARIGLARCYFEMGNLTLSKESIALALAQEPKSVDAMILLGRIETALKRYDEAEAVLNRALEVEPARLEIRYRLGDLYRVQGKHREAIALYREILKIDPRDVMANIYLGILYTELGELERAGAYYRKAVSIDSHDPLTHLNLARHYYRMGVTIARKDPLDAEEYLEAGISETRTAIAILEEALLGTGEDSLVLRKETAGAYRLIAGIEFFRKRYEQVIDALRRAIELGDRSHIAYYELGFSHEMLGNRADALDAYRSSLSRRIDNEIVRFRLENLLLSLYRTDLYNPDKLFYSDYHFREGRFNLEKNIFDKAFLHHKRAVMLDPVDPDKRLALAELFLRQRYDEQYLVELRDIVQQTLDVDSVDLNDRIEIYEARVRKNLASRWTVRQYEEDAESPYYVPKTKTRIAVLNAFESDYTGEDFIHRRFSLTFAEMLNLVLNYYEKIDVAPVYGEVFGNPGALPEVMGPRQALQEARRLGAQYYVTGNLVEREDSLKVNVEIYSAFNGMPLHELTTYYTGNDRVFNTVVSLAASLNRFAPLRGMIVRMEGNRALINLGKAQGVEREMMFHIVKEGGLNVDPETGEYEYDEAVVLGELTVTGTDEMIAEGIYTHSGLFNRVNVYDHVVLKLAEVQDEEENGETRKR